MTIHKTRITAAIGAILLLGAVASPASARWGDRDERYGERHGERHGERYDERWEHHHWNGGYYRSPPVVYGYPYGYYPPPVVYGPGVGIYLPGVNLNIR